MLELEQVRRYGWADQDPNLVWTLAVVIGRTTDDVIRAYGGDIDRAPVSLPFAQAQVPLTNWAPTALSRSASKARTSF